MRAALLQPAVVEVNARVDAHADDGGEDGHVVEVDVFAEQRQARDGGHAEHEGQHPGGRDEQRRADDGGRLRRHRRLDQADAVVVHLGDLAGFLEATQKGLILELVGLQITLEGAEDGAQPPLVVDVGSELPGGGGGRPAVTFVAMRTLNICTVTGCNNICAGF